ncbi:MAG: hypothetical protein HOP19_13210 [Acidobacteria bacterium]|nr:hypothetical protein [Acidobacteriota bacterium]
MKILWLAFLSTSLALPILAQQKTDKNMNDLRGAVHTISTTVILETKEAGKTVKRDADIDNSEVYDRQGNLVEKKAKAGLNLQQSVFSRDAQGQRIEKMADGPPNPLAPPRPAVPGGGERNADFLTFITAYRYDAEKRQLEATTHRRSGQLLQVDTYLFDEKERVLEHSRTYSVESGGGGFRFVHKYDERGALIESLSYKVNSGQVEHKTQYQGIVLDQQGNWIKRTETMTGADGKPRNAPIVSVRQITYY